MRVYIAGAMSSKNPITFLDNLRKGMRLSTRVLLVGHAVFSPFIDFQLFFMTQEDEEITVTQVKAASMAWLKVSEAVLLVPGWENSQGTKDEIAEAERLGIPVYDSLAELEYANHKGE